MYCGGLIARFIEALKAHAVRRALSKTNCPLRPPSANKGLTLHDVLAFSTKYMSCFVCAVGDSPKQKTARRRPGILASASRFGSAMIDAVIDFSFIHDRLPDFIARTTGDRRSIRR